MGCSSSKRKFKLGKSNCGKFKPKDPHGQWEIEASEFSATKSEFATKLSHIEQSSQSQLDTAVDREAEKSEDKSVRQVGDNSYLRVTDNGYFKQ